MTTSPSAHSSDSSILLALQKQWECQEKLDMEHNQMEKEKEERKRMKEEREQRKEDRKMNGKMGNQQRSRINKAFKKIPRFDGTNPSYCFDWLEQTEALVNEHHGRIYREELLLNCGTSHKELQIKSSRMQCWGTTQISGLYHRDQMHISNCTRSQMKLCRVTIPGMLRSSI